MLLFFEAEYRQTFKRKNKQTEGSRRKAWAVCACFSNGLLGGNQASDKHRTVPPFFIKIIMGQFVNEHLIKDEVVVYEPKIHWAIWVWPIVWAAVCAITLVLIPVSIIILGWTLLKYKSIELAITNKRIIAKHGIISKHTLEQNLNKIESVQVHQGMLERVFGKGSVIIVGTGGTREMIPDIEDPFEFRKKFAEVSA